MAEDQDSADKAFDHFVKTYQDKYSKAVACPKTDRETLLDFYDFPAVLVAHPDNEPHRIDHCDDSAPEGPHEGKCKRGHYAGHNLQAGNKRQEILARIR